LPPGGIEPPSTG